MTRVGTCQQQGGTKLQGATGRAKVRRGANACKKPRSSNAGTHDAATALPNSEEEVTTFIAIVRDSMNHEARKEDGALFEVEQREQLRRVAGLGISAHQLAIAAYCKAG